MTGIPDAPVPGTAAPDYAPGLGAAGTAVVVMRALGESVPSLKLVSIALILAGVIGLNLSGVTPP